ncbi:MULTISPECIES: TIGR04255 family protein [unclassified Rhizobium]|jgi:uncharacterized protein (TIGR04255 family)|uniref:TIGR04255 family protein n=1 Tax=unclassified Rhizobium TaxID=2613769 RepID=UPI000DD655E3|nr:TIGR04255 family protein [Rhizobium sp. UBA1881]
MSDHLRPNHLANFARPPLNEVVVGVQFNPAMGYGQIRAGEVWSLFKDGFPAVEEQVPLPPSFETFGIPSPPTFNFGMVSGGQHDRFWFLTEDQQELIQFQADRLLHNWRKVPGGVREYPRFEYIISSFQNELHDLETYFDSLAPQRLHCTQAEITYINHIILNKTGTGSQHSDWVRDLAFGRQDPEDINCTWRRSLHIDGAPRARLIVEAKTGFDFFQQRLLLLNITVRGSPLRPDIEDTIDFLKYGREIIISEFASMTTDFAHGIWERIS